MKLGFVFLLGLLLSFSKFTLAADSVHHWVAGECCVVDGTNGIYVLDTEGGTHRAQCIPKKSEDTCVPRDGTECLTESDGKPGVWVPPTKSNQKFVCIGRGADSTTPPSKECLPEEVIAKCTEAEAAATSDCNTKNNPRVFDSRAAIDQIAHGLAAKVAGDQTSGSTNAVCSKLGKAAATLNGALAGWNTVCTSSRSSCLESCRFVKEEAKRCFTQQYGKGGSPEEIKRLADASKADQEQYAEKIATCTALDTNLAHANQEMHDAVTMAKQMGSCKDDTDGLGSPEEYCKARPTDLGCQAVLAQNCANPSYAAANRICACAGANQNSEACRLALKPGADAIASKGVGLGVSGAGGKSTPINLGDDGETPEGFKMNAVAYGEDPGGAKGGHGFPGGGGGNSIGGSPNRGGGFPPEEKPGGGFMSANPGGGGSGGGFLGGISSAIKQLLGGPEKKEKPLSLDKFRPDFKRPPISMRGLAGATGPDGITGPNSDIWLKVKNQYHLQLFTFILSP
jgi:hypothetical protein